MPNIPKAKLLIIGHGRHGKDTVCEFLRDEYGYQFVSSSWFCAEHVVRPYLEAEGYFYSSVQECYDDRHNKRSSWFNAIAQYNEKDPSRLSREIAKEYDIYCGLRNRKELLAAKEAGVFDMIVWVDASDRHPPESTDSCTVTKEDADYVLDNNGDLPHLRNNIRFLVGAVSNLLHGRKNSEKD